MRTTEVPESGLAISDYGTAKMNYQSFLDKKMSAHIATDMERSQLSERFAVADPAHKPENPIKPKRLVMYLGSSLFALVLGFTLGPLLEFRQDVFLGEWEMPPGVPILGRVGTLVVSLVLLLSAYMASSSMIARVRIGWWF